MRSIKKLLLSKKKYYIDRIVQDDTKTYTDDNSIFSFRKKIKRQGSLPHLPAQQLLRLLNYNKLTRKHNT